MPLTISLSRFLHHHVSMTSRVLYSAQYRRQHSTLQAFEQFAALYIRPSDLNVCPTLANVIQFFVFTWMLPLQVCESSLHYHPYILFIHRHDRTLITPADIDCTGVSVIIFQLVQPVLELKMSSNNVTLMYVVTLSFQIQVIISHLKLWIAVAKHNFK